MMKHYAVHSRSAAFTLVELLTVIGIIAVLLTLLMPALGAARKAAQATQCASNLRQLTTAMMNYAAEFKGFFPGNVGAETMYWYNKDQIGRYLKGKFLMSDSEQCVDGVFLCPGDLDGSRRCYSMNIYASSSVSSFVSASLDGPASRGKLWKSSVGNGSNMILLIESFSFEDWPAVAGGGGPGVGASGEWASPAVVGYVPPSPGGRFGGPDAQHWSSVRFGDCEAQVCFFRHRGSRQYGAGLGDSVGRLHIGFADGHVQLHSHSELFDATTGDSTYQAMWSPNDREVQMNY